MKRIGLWGVLATFILVFAAGFVSYLWLPRAQLNAPRNLFEAFCLALGMPQAAPRGAQAPPQPHSQVLLTHETLKPFKADDVGEGATLALRCTPCHGPTGISYANSPNLAGQYAMTVYKQLRDFKSGVRANAIMSALAPTLTDLQMQQIAAYYASLSPPVGVPASDDPPPIVKWGAPMRNVAPCDSCHGGSHHTAASPWLYGEPADYLRAQLNAFAAGERSNDINGQMRAMARGMTAAEIDSAATYFGGNATHP